jgi:hypothetical protein
VPQATGSDVLDESMTGVFERSFCPAGGQDDIQDTLRRVDHPDDAAIERVGRLRYTRPRCILSVFFAVRLAGSVLCGITRRFFDLKRLKRQRGRSKHNRGANA